jgi:hypothetical protein
MVCTQEIPGDRFFQKALRQVEMGHQEIVGVLRELVVLCCAFGVDLQRTSREQVVDNQEVTKSKKNEKWRFSP